MEHNRSIRALAALLVASTGWPVAAPAWGSEESSTKRITDRCTEDGTKEKLSESWSDFVICIVANESGSLSVMPSRHNRRSVPLTTDTISVVATASQDGETPIKMTIQSASKEGGDDGPSESTVTLRSGTTMLVGTLSLPEGAETTLTTNASKGNQNASLSTKVSSPVTGGLRLGFATVMGPAASRSFYTQPSRLNAEQRVSYDASSGIDMEVVLGYTRYMHRRPEKAAGFRIAPFGAAGVLNISDAPTLTQRSVYLGVDLGWDDLSIGPSFLVRQVPALAGDLQPGSIIAESTPPTVNVWQPGVSVVINLPHILDSKR